MKGPNLDRHSQAHRCKVAGTLESYGYAALSPGVEARELNQLVKERRRPGELIQMQRGRNSERASIQIEMIKR